MEAIEAGTGEGANFVRQARINSTAEDKVRQMPKQSTYAMNCYRRNIPIKPQGHSSGKSF